MTDIKFHPLVDADTEGTEKVPAFLGKDRGSVQKYHKLYLEEIVQRRYRLCSSADMTAETAASFTIHCPRCGAKLKAISPQTNGTRHALYICPRCG